MELSTYIYLVFCNFLNLERNKPNCGGNSLSETYGNKKAKKSKQTNKKFDSLPRIFFLQLLLDPK